MARVLIVDDEMISSFFLGSSLEEEGHEVQTASRVDEAIQAALSFKPQVVITDWMLKSDDTGIDVARALQCADPQVRVIFMTGLPGDELKSRLEDVVAFRILEKPVETEIVINCVAEAVAARSAG